MQSRLERQINGQKRANITPHARPGMLVHKNNVGQNISVAEVTGSFYVALWHGGHTSDCWDNLMQRHVANRKPSSDPSGTSSSPPRGHSRPVSVLMPLPWFRLPFNLIIVETLPKRD
jgi:hypothetical protein